MERSFTVEIVPNCIANLTHRLVIDSNWRINLGHFIPQSNYPRIDQKLPKKNNFGLTRNGDLIN